MDPEIYSSNFTDFIDRVDHSLSTRSIQLISI